MARHEQKERLDELKTQVLRHDAEPIHWHHQRRLAEASQTIQDEKNILVQTSSRAGEAQTASDLINTTVAASRTLGFKQAAREKFQRKNHTIIAELTAKLDLSQQLAGRQIGDQQVSERQTREQRSVTAITTLRQRRQIAVSRRLTTSARRKVKRQQNADVHHGRMASRVLKREATTQDIISATSLQREQIMQCRSQHYTSDRHNLRNKANRAAIRYQVSQQTSSYGLHQQQVRALQTQQADRQQTRNVNSLDREIRAETLFASRSRYQGTLFRNKVRSDLRLTQKKIATLNQQITTTLQESEHSQHHSLLIRQKRILAAEHKKSQRELTYHQRNRNNRVNALRGSRHSDLSMMSAEIAARNMSATHYNSNEYKVREQRQNKLLKREQANIAVLNSYSAQKKSAKTQVVRATLRRGIDFATKRNRDIVKEIATTEQVQHEALLGQRDRIIARETAEQTSQNKSKNALQQNAQEQRRTLARLQVTTLLSKNNSRKREAREFDADLRSKIDEQQNELLQREQELTQYQEELHQTQYTDHIEEHRQTLQKKRTHVLNRLEELSVETTTFSAQQQHELTEKKIEILQRECTTALAMQVTTHLQAKDKLAAVRDKDRARIISNETHIHTHEEIARDFVDFEANNLQSRQQRLQKQEQISLQHQHIRELEQQELTIQQAARVQRDAVHVVQKNLDLADEAAKEQQLLQQTNCTAKGVKIINNEQAMIARTNNQHIVILKFRLQEQRRRARRKAIFASDYKGPYYWLSETAEFFRRRWYSMNQAGRKGLHAVTNVWHRSKDALQLKLWQPATHFLHSSWQALANNGRRIFSSLQRGVSVVGTGLAKLRRPFNQAKHSIKQALGNTQTSIHNSIVAATVSMQNNITQPLTAEGSHKVDTVATGGRNVIVASKKMGRSIRHGALVLAPNILREGSQVASDGATTLAIGLVALYVVTLKPGKEQLGEALRELGHQGVIMLGHYLYYRANQASTQIKHAAKTSWHVASIGGQKTLTGVKDIIAIGATEMAVGSKTIWHSVSSKTTAAGISAWYALPPMSTVSHGFKQMSRPMLHGGEDTLHHAWYAAQDCGGEILAQGGKSVQVILHGGETFAQDFAYKTIYSVHVVQHSAKLSLATIANKNEDGWSAVKQGCQVIGDETSDAAKKWGRMTARTLRTPVRKIINVSCAVSTTIFYAGDEAGNSMYFLAWHAGAAIADTTVQICDTTRDEVQKSAINLVSGGHKFVSDVTTQGNKAAGLIYYGVQELAPVGSSMYDGAVSMTHQVEDVLIPVTDFSHKQIVNLGISLGFAWQATATSTQQLGNAGGFAIKSTASAVSTGLAKPIDYIGATCVTTGEVVSDLCGEAALTASNKFEGVSIFFSYHKEVTTASLGYMSSVAPASIGYGVAATADMLIVTPVRDSVEVLTEVSGEKGRAIADNSKAMVTNLSCFWHTKAPVVSGGMQMIAKDMSLGSKKAIQEVGIGFRQALTNPTQQGLQTTWLGFKDLFHGLNIDVMHARAILEHEKEKDKAQTSEYSI